MKNLKKFIVRRDVPLIGATPPEQWACNAARANRIVAEMSPDLIWLESIICDDTAYCVYFATDADVVRRYSERVGFPASAVEEIRSVIQPCDADTAATARVVATYNSAADHFDAPQLAFWRRAGRRSVERLGLRKGAHVLDVGCGTGASAIPAAEVVGSSGSVLGVDLAESLLELARSKAAARGLTHAKFEPRDMRTLGFPDGRFDAVISVFSLFFATDMQALLRELWRMVATGGSLSVTTWGPRMFEPASELWWRAVATERPDLVEEFRPWDAISSAAGLRKLFLEAGLPEPAVHEVADRQELRVPEDWWSVALGSGLRWTVDRLGADAAERVKKRNLDSLVAAQVTSMECNTIQAVVMRSESAAGIGDGAGKEIEE